MTTNVILCKVFGGCLDLVVVGAGPAGLAAAVSSAALGLRVGCIAPGHRQPWQASYAGWQDELTGIAASSVQASWSEAIVRWSDEPHTLARRYARIDTPRLQAALLTRAQSLGVRFGDAEVMRIDEQRDHSEIHTRSGQRQRASVVVDASGAHSLLTKRVDERPLAYQSAYGLLIEVAEHPLPLDSMLLMDLRDVGAGPPSFLYAMPLSKTQLFVEETSLTGRPGLAPEQLRERLIKRLAGMQITIRHELAVEHCSIAMGVAPPRAGQRIIGFGAAGGMVHPATGYQLNRSLRTAPLLAGAILNGLDTDGPAQATANAYQLLWPASQRRCWELYTFGMEALCRFDGASLRAFMKAFFLLPEPLWRGYLAAELPLSDLCRAMWNVFSTAEPTLRWRLVQLGASGGAKRLFGALSPPNHP